MGMVTGGAVVAAERIWTKASLTAGGPRLPAACCWRIKRRDALLGDAGSPAYNPQRPGGDFLPLPDHPARQVARGPRIAHSSRKQETRARPSSAALRACGCGPAVVALSIAIRPRWARS